jgi:hypothetical protein
MIFKIHSVVNGKTPAEEFVWLFAMDTVLIKGYALVDRTFDDKGKVSNEYRHIFVFPDLKIEKDEWIQLYTGVGTYKKIESNIDERKCFVHKLYWGSNASIWNNKGGDIASLIQFKLINSVPVGAVENK